MQCVLAQAARELDEALRADAVGLAAALHAERDRVADVQLPARARAEYHLVEVVRPRRGHGASWELPGRNLQAKRADTHSAMPHLLAESCAFWGR